MVNQAPEDWSVDTGSSGWGMYFALAAFLALAMLPIAYYGVSSEFARWKVARARLHQRHGESEKSLELLGKAFEQAGHNQTIKLEFANQLMANGQAEQALDLLDSVIQFSSNPRVPIEAKARCLMHLNRRKEALDYFKSTADYLDASEFQQPYRMNEMAYYRALAKTELGYAEDDIASAIEKTEDYLWWMNSPIALPLADQVLVAASIVSSQIGKSDWIVSKLDKRIQERRDLVDRKQANLSQWIYSLAIRNEVLGSVEEKKIQAGQIDVRTNEEFLSVMLVARALIHQSLDDDVRCDRDRLAVQEMDFDPDELLAAIPADWDLMNVMIYSAPMLDTDAVVKYARGEDLMAAGDQLDLAILATRLLRETNRGTLQNTLKDESGTRFADLNLGHSEAVMRWHRSKVRKRLGQLELAEADIQKIRDLGEEPGDDLF